MGPKLVGGNQLLYGRNALKIFDFMKKCKFNLTS